MVQRYNECEWCGDEYGKDAGMIKNDKGHYVVYSDYEKLVKAFGLARSMVLASEDMTPEAEEVFEQALKEAEKP